MPIDNEIYSRKDFDWWDNGPNSPNVMLRHFINPIRFAYFNNVLKQKVDGDASNGALLDVGCGGGYLCEDFAKLGFDVTGIDPSKNSLKSAKRHAAQECVIIDYKEARAETLPFADASFDCVSCCDVLEHVDNQKETISEIARVLKPNGLFFYDTINRTWISWLVIIKVAQDWKRTAWELPNTHEWRRFVKPSELNALMKSRGLAMQENKGIGPSKSPFVVRNAFRQRAKGKISRRAMARRFGFSQIDNLSGSYMGFAIKQK